MFVLLVYLVGFFLLMFTFVTDISRIILVSCFSVTFPDIFWLVVDYSPDGRASNQQMFVFLSPSEKLKLKALRGKYQCHSSLLFCWSLHVIIIRKKK
jgi:hypothetical protein